MKRVAQLTGLILMCLILSFTAVSNAQTENKDLPTESQILNFIDSVDNPSVTSLSETSMDENPSLKWDTWKNGAGNKNISFYYVDSDSKRGYGSLYFDNNGNKLSIACGNYDLIKSYTGEDKEDTEDEENEVKEQPEEKQVHEEDVKEEKEQVTEDEDDEHVAEEEESSEDETKITIEVKSRIISKIANVLINFNNNKYQTLDDVKEALDNVFED